VRPADFNQYGTRRGNHEVMMRGTFANIRIKNFMLKGADGNIPEGGLTKHWPDGEQMSIYDAAMKYQAEQVPLVVFAGAEYGNGSSRDWAAKGTRLLGVRAVICQSTSWQSLGLKGDEKVTIRGLQGDLKPRQTLTAEIVSGDDAPRHVPLLCRIDTLDELDYYRNGGILHYVLRKLAA
jgi:aconitate hydratase